MTHTLWSARTLSRLSFILLAAVCFFGASGTAWLAQSGAAPQLRTEATYDAVAGKLVIKGSNLHKQASLSLHAPGGPLALGRVKVKGAKKIVIHGVRETDLRGGVDAVVTNPDGLSSQATRLTVRTTGNDRRLTEGDVKTIIAQAVAHAEAAGLRASVAVVDNEGNILGVFRMNGASATTRVGVGRACTPSGDARLPLRCGLEGVRVPSCTAAIAKAVTGSFLSTAGHAFSTRTASFIVQEHFPPGLDFQPSGPLFGVQFSQLLCSDVNPRSPLGLSADPGGLPLYKNGVKVGGVGVEGDGAYTLDADPTDDDVPVEELVARGATRGFEAPAAITGDKIILNGIRFPYVNAPMPAPVAVPPFEALRGQVDGCVCLPPDNTTCLAPGEVRGSLPSEFVAATLDGAPPGRINLRLFPDGTKSFKSGGGLTRAEVLRILAQAAQQAFVTRAAIRRPLNSAAEVNIAVVDAEGVLLGLFSTADAPVFGFDVAVQKARTAAFFSKATAGRQLRQAGFARYVEAAARDGIGLDGAIAFSDRANGFLSRPFYPDGVNNTAPGPFSVPIADFSPFNDGLQLDLILDEYFGNIVRLLGGDVDAGLNALTPPCPRLGSIANGIQIFAGSVPLYKDGRLVGGVGISGDGVEQDDIIAAMGSKGFEAPAAMRADQFFVRGVRLPFVKFPRNPNR